MSEDDLSGWLKSAFKESLNGKHKDQLVGCLLLRGGNVVARSSNYSRPHGTLNRGFHAEERVLRHNNTRGCTLVVVRANNRGKLSTMSRPCDKCFPLLRKKGIKKIVYINWKGEVCNERVRL